MSLATKICIGKGELKTVFRTVLEEIPNGTEVIRDQLDGLKEDTSGDLSASIQVNIGNGKLYEHEKPGEQAILLKDLLSLRNRMRVGRSSAALTNLFKHPVTFILEKWGQRDRGCLRCEQTYLAVNDTSQGAHSSNGTFVSVGEPYFNRTNENDETQDFQDVNICHPQPDFSRDASRIAFLCMGIFSTLLLFVKVCIAFRFQYFSSTRILTMVTLGIAIVLITNAFIVDHKDIPLNSTFLKPGTGNNFKLFVFASSAYFMVHLILKMFCFNVIKEKIFLAYHREPEEYMQWFTLLVTISSTFFIDTLTRPSNISGITSGVVALSSATGATVLVIKIGQSGFTAFGNFSTMFHIILCKQSLTTGEQHHLRPLEEWNHGLHDELRNDRV